MPIIDRSGEHTFLLTPEQAALDILYMFMTADGQADEQEFDITKEYLKTDFARNGSLFNEKHSLYAGTNFNKEFAYLKTLDAKMLRSRYVRALKVFHEWLGEHPEAEKVKNELVQFALKIIAADGKLTSNEKELMETVKKEWGIEVLY